jgi:seryl-tRNA synthetase
MDAKHNEEDCNLFENNISNQNRKYESFSKAEHCDEEFNEFFDDEDGTTDNVDFDNTEFHEKKLNENFRLMEMANTLHTQFNSVKNSMEQLQKKHEDAIELIEYLCCNVMNVSHRNTLRTKMINEVDNAYLKLIGNSTSSLLYLLNVNTRLCELDLLVYDIEHDYTIETKKPKKTCTQILKPYFLVSFSFLFGAITYSYYII